MMECTRFVYNTILLLITEEEKAKAIEKALAFSGTILAKKNQHSSNVKEEPRTEAVKAKNTTATTPAKSSKRKRKMLQILSEEEPAKKKKVHLSDNVQIPAKPEGFLINSQPAKNKKLNKVTPKRIGTSAGSFEIEPVPAQKAKSPFTVTTLNYNPSLKFNTFKDKAIFNSNVKRESAAELLGRKRKQKKLQRN